MTKKDYELIADTLKTSFTHTDIRKEDQKRIINDFCVSLYEENDRFQAVKFHAYIFE